MVHVLFATCDRLPDATPSDQVLQRALEERGAKVSVLPWSSIDRDPPADLILLRSTWDYHKRIQEFRSWLSGLEAAGRRVLNPIPTVRWNLDKAYLRDLAAQGIAIPETRFEYNLTPARLAALMATMGWSHAVVKPRISATAHGTFLVSAGAMVDSLAPTWESGALVQAYMNEVEQGELSLMFFGGEYSHAVSKKPKPGDFRVQTDFGGSVEPVSPSEAAIRFATRVLDHTAPVDLRTRGYRGDREGPPSDGTRADRTPPVFRGRTGKRRPTGRSPRPDCLESGHFG